MMFLFALNSERALISLCVKLSGLPLVLLYSFMRSFSTFCNYFSMFSHSLTGGIHLDFARNGSSFCFEGCVAK